MLLLMCLLLWPITASDTSVIQLFVMPTYQPQPEGRYAQTVCCITCWIFPGKQLYNQGQYSSRQEMSASATIVLLVWPDSLF